jgi:hypothetical protein
MIDLLMVSDALDPLDGTLRRGDLTWAGVLVEPERRSVRARI